MVLLITNQLVRDPVSRILFVNYWGVFNLVVLISTLRLRMSRYQSLRPILHRLLNIIKDLGYINIPGLFFFFGVLQLQLRNRPATRKLISSFSLRLILRSIQLMLIIMQLLHLSIPPFLMLLLIKPSNK